jgi:hypothetical protein
MAVPPRPVSGEFATSEWGDWVHDSLISTQRSIVKITGLAAGLDLSSGTQVQWPSNNTVNVTVPAWASKVFVMVTLSGLYPAGGGDCTAEHRLYLNGVHVETATNGYGVVTAQTYQFNITGQTDVTLKRGQSITINTSAARMSGTGSLRVTANSRYTWDIDFRP